MTKCDECDIEGQDDEERSPLGYVFWKINNHDGQSQENAVLANARFVSLSLKMKTWEIFCVTDQALTHVVTIELLSSREVGVELK